MKVMAIKYGAFDFIVDNKGLWWFLECNESGQFLWLEEELPDLGLLNGFARWLAKEAGIAVENKTMITLEEFKSSGEWEKALEIWPGPHKKGVYEGEYVKES